MLNRYMKAHLRNNRVDPVGLSPVDIADSFMLLPEPAKPFEVWLGGIEVWEKGIGAADDTQDVELTQEEMLKANDLAVANIEALNG
jgi:hypothetical protein